MSEFQFLPTFAPMNLKSVLFRLLGTENYLRVVSRLFFFSYKTGKLHSDPDYDCHYYVRNLIKSGDTVVDIGGNLGYYSVLFAEWVGASGKVYTVEPVPMYRKVLAANTAKFNNITVYPYALGTENGKQVTLGVPTGHGHFRHGLTHIIGREDNAEHSHTFTAEMRRGSDLFADLERLDYLKMDVEGYEVHILPEIQPILEKHRPVIQVELGHATRAPLLELLEGMDYKAHFVRGKELLPLWENEAAARGDLIFLPTV